MIKTYIDISPAKNKRVCQNCKHFEKFGVHLGVCLNCKKYTEKLDNQTCNRFDLNTNKMKHLIYTYKNKTYEAYKDWSFMHCEAVLARLGATYWEIG